MKMIIGPRLASRLAFSTATALLCAPMVAHAQGYPNGIRSGTNGSPPAAATAPSSPGAIPVTAPSRGSVGNRNMGTGQGPLEGAMGMSPQLQKELGIARQQ